jgi:hypothetical protein
VVLMSLSEEASEREVLGSLATAHMHYGIARHDEVFWANVTLSNN